MVDEKGCIDVSFISRFEATKLEIDKARKLCDDRTFGKLNTSAIRRVYGPEIEAKVIKIFKENPEVLAQGRYDYGLIKDITYHLNFKKEHRGKVIYGNQYHLNAEKRLAFIYDTFKKLDAGIYKHDDGSPHNTPVIIIAKTVKKKNGKSEKRFRTAHDFSRLNQYLEDVQTILPTKPIINHILGIPGPVILFDLHSCFETFPMHGPDQFYTRFMTPIGPMQMTRATYGYKTIMALVQGYNHKKFVEGIKDLAKAIIFVDDGIIKLRPGISPEEYLVILRRLVAILKETGYKINPAKLYLFVEDYIFCGIVHTQTNHFPTPEYVQKCIDVDLPVTDRDVQCITAGFRFIDEYIYDMAGTLEPITRLESKQKIKEWGPEQFTAFNLIKEKIKKYFKLDYPTLDGKIFIQSDANGKSFAVAYFQRIWDPILNKHVYKLIRFYSGVFPKHIQELHIQVKETYAGVHGMVKAKDLCARAHLGWITDSKASKYFWDNKAYTLCTQPVMIRLRREVAGLIFTVYHANADWIEFVDFLNRIGEHSQHQHYRERIKYQKIKDQMHKLKQLSLIQFLQQAHDYSDTGIHNILSIRLSLPKFETNDDYYDYQRSMIAFREVAYGNTDLIVNGIDFSVSYDNDILVNNLRFNGSIDKLISNYHSSTRNFLNQRDIAQLDKECIYLINSVTSPNSCYNHSKQQSNIRSILENEYYDNKRHSLTGICSRLSNKLGVWNGSKAHGLTYTPEGETSIKLNPIRVQSKQSKQDKKKDKRLQFNLNGQFDQSPFSLSSSYKPCIKNSKRVIIPKLTNKLPTESEIDASLEQARKNMFHNYFSCCRHNYDPTESILIKSCQVFRLFPISLSPLALPRRSPRLANKPRVDYRGMDEQLPESQESKYDGYHVGIPTEDDLSSTKFVKFFKRLQSKYPSNSTKKIFDMEAFRAAQQLDSKIRAVYDSIETNNKSILSDVLNSPLDNYWFKGISNNYFSIVDGILYFDDKSHELAYENGRLVVPDVFKIAIVKYFHNSMHHHHSGAPIVYAYLQYRFWWCGMETDVKFITNSCSTCNESKGKCDSLELNPWFTQNPGELLIYDFAGPYFNSIYISCFMDDFTGISQLRVVTGCDAIVVCELLLSHWVIEHGFPIQMIGDLGASNFNELLFIIQTISGVDGLYASPRRHQSIGKIERLIQELNKQFRELNIELDGSITDATNREQAIFQVRQFLPSVQFYLNSKCSPQTGYSPNQLDKGRHLRTIPDVKVALSSLKKQIKKGLPKRDQVEYLRDLQQRLFNYQQNKRVKYLRYLLRRCNNHDSKHNSRQHKYRKGQFVGFYVGDCSNTTQKWRARYRKSIFIQEINNGQVQIRDLVDNKTKTVTKQLIKPYHVNDPLWKDEISYQQMVEMRQNQTNTPKVTFQSKTK